MSGRPIIIEHTLVIFSPKLKLTTYNFRAIIGVKLIRYEPFRLLQSHVVWRWPSHFQIRPWLSPPIRSCKFFPVWIFLIQWYSIEDKDWSQSIFLKSSNKADRPALCWPSHCYEGNQNQMFKWTLLVSTATVYFLSNLNSLSIHCVFFVIVLSSPVLGRAKIWSPVAITSQFLPK